jgi:uncharacterized protein (DUF3820 family)
MSGTNVIPFGKYKGRSVHDIAAQDPAYLQWLMQQDWFVEKYQWLIVNITNIHATAVETPAHNAMQVRFLDEAYRNAFAWEVRYFDPEKQFRKVMVDNAKWVKSGAPSRGYSYQWAAWRKSPERRGKVLDARRQRQQYRAAARSDEIVVKCVTGDPQFEVITDVAFEVRLEASALGFRDWEGFNVLVEVKPSMGDDYPAVLRQMKQQRQQLITLDQMHRAPFSPSSCVWVLQVGQYTGMGASFDQVIQVFEAGGIVVVM